jgi:hypothetical protein
MDKAPELIGRVTARCMLKVRAMVEEGEARVAGLLVRKGDRLAIVTNEGRVEWFAASELGGIEQSAADELRMLAVRAELLRIAETIRRELGVE